VPGFRHLKENTLLKHQDIYEENKKSATNKSAPGDLLCLGAYGVFSGVFLKMDGK
jgi:hypothetical protein